MKYIAPDGYIMRSDPNQPVTYSCPCTNMGTGIYESLETGPAATSIGIQQIKIHRVIDEGIMTITITESTDAELLQYLDSLKPTN